MKVSIFYFNTRKYKLFSDEIFEVPRFKYNSREEGRYLIVTVIILFLSAPCPRCRSRLKPKIDVEGKIKVVKFLVSINARRVYISAHVCVRYLCLSRESVVFLIVFKPQACRGRLFSRRETIPLPFIFLKVSTSNENLFAPFKVDVVQENHHAYTCTFRSEIRSIELFKNKWIIYFYFFC